MEFNAPPDPGDTSTVTIAAAETETEERSGANQFIRDTRTEKVLGDHNLKAEFVVVALADIDLSALDRGVPERQMRDEVIHLDVAHRYADDLAWGSEFPAGVLSRRGNNFAVVDFHHRLWAARHAKLTDVSAYVVPELGDFDLIELGNLLNRNHGVPLSEHERVRQALWGLDLGRFKTVRQAAKVLGIKEQTVSRAKRVRECREMAQKAGVSLIAFDHLPIGSRERLAAIDSPEVFKEAVNNVINKGLGTQQVNELVTKINEAGGDAAKLEVVGNYAAHIEPRKPAGSNNLADPYFRLHTALRAILAVDNSSEFDMALARRSAEDLSTLYAEINDVTEKLGGIAAKLDAIEAPAAPQADAV